MEIEKKFMNFHIKADLGMEFTTCEGELIQTGAPTSLTVCDIYRYFAVIVMDVTK